MTVNASIWQRTPPRSCSDKPARRISALILALLGACYVQAPAAADECNCGKNDKFNVNSCASEVFKVDALSNKRQPDVFAVVALPPCLDPNQELLLISLRHRGKALIANTRTREQFAIDGDPSWERADEWVFAGLHDFEFDKRFYNADDKCGTVYYSFVGTNAGSPKNKSLRVSSARLNRSESGRWSIKDIRRLLTVKNNESGVDSYSLFGSRLLHVPRDDSMGGLFISIGDHFSSTGYDIPNNSQDEESYIGKLVRISDPLADSITPQIVALGLRDPQGLAITPHGVLISDHGPNGGDELNRFAENGANFGWPRCTNGSTYPPPERLPRFQHCDGVVRPYLDLPISDLMRSGEHFAPSGIHYYEAKGGANDIRRWNGALLIASLTRHGILLVRPAADDQNEPHRVPLFEDGAYRDLTQTQDGKLFVVTDNRGSGLHEPVDAARICRVIRLEN